MGSDPIRVRVQDSVQVNLATLNADGLSRLPQVEKKDMVKNSSPLPPEYVMLLNYIAQSPLTWKQIAVWTQQTPLLTQVMDWVRHGWPEPTSNEDSSLQPYKSKKQELSVLDGCLVWKNRVLVPEQGRKAVLEELHGSHQGIPSMKGRARACVWWPGKYKAIEDAVKGCHTCQSNSSIASNSSKPSFSWPWSANPWSRIHLDFAGPVENQMILVVIDSHSKWIEAIPMVHATSCATKQHLKKMFAQFGIPRTVVTDNGSPFVSQEFEQFLVKSGINHLTSSPYHPATNGQAERAVQIVKQGLKKLKTGTMVDRLAQILFHYRITPHTSTGATPAMLLMGRELRSLLDLTKPNLSQKVMTQQEKQIHKEVKGKRSTKEFNIGDKVYVRNFRPGTKWIGGEVALVNGPVNYAVELDTGHVVRRHIEHIKQRTNSIPASQISESLEAELFSETINLDQEDPIPRSFDRSSPQPPNRTPPRPPNRTSSRVRRPPDRLAPFVTH